MKKDNNNSYLDSIHRIGRIGSVGTLIIMLGIPLVISYTYKIWPQMDIVLKVSSGLLAMFIPIAISEIVSYMPILGSASYISFITGNVVNIKLPVAINALSLAEVEAGTEEGDVIANFSVAVSSLATILIIAFGVVLLIPLTPIFENPQIQIASEYMLSAVYGGIFIPMLMNKKAGEYTVKGKLIPVIIIMSIIILINTFITPIVGKEGYALLLVIPSTFLLAKALYKKGIIELY